jgi:hypothetical protein
VKVRYFADTGTLPIELRDASQHPDAPHFSYEQVAA